MLDEPDWLAVLRLAVARHKLRSTARTVGYSAATLHHVLNGTYKGRLDKVEEAVRAKLMAARVDCPFQGDIPSSSCLNLRRSATTAAGPLALNCRRQRARGCRYDSESRPC